MIFYTVLIYLIIALVGNVTFYFACQGEYDSCAVVSSVFFNISVLCQILPLFINKEEHEKNQKNGQKLICSLYLLFTIIVSVWSMCFDVSYVTSGTIQIIMLGIFLIAFFSVAKANVKSNRSISEAETNRSSSLMEAKANIRCAIATCVSGDQRAILREASAELDSMSISYDNRLAIIDGEILTKVSMLCNNPDNTLKKELSQLIQKRKCMTMLTSH
ncbi:MAG: hypothetical protein K2K45_06855 [Muribaculaceae bacterium]|nr:hypothetical protein [Muribaculaceae bacterium]